MKAAVVESFDHPPRYRDFDEPVAESDEVIVSVRAAALSQLARAQAAGRHYTSGRPPFVPGPDGVGVLDSGRRVYFAFPRAPGGALAQRVAVKAANIVALPAEVDDVTAAAIANPAMSSWAALIERAAFQRGEAVLINGANGASGRLAIQIAKYLGAGRVIATGRNPASESELRALGADVFIPLLQSPEALAARFRDEIASGVDVVLDYLWGPSAETFMMAAAHGAGETAPRIRFVNIGALGGATIALGASTLRSSGVELVGSGLGSLSQAALLRAVASLMPAIKAAGLQIDAAPKPFAEVETAWAINGAARTVFTL